MSPWRRLSSVDWRAKLRPYRHGANASRDG